MILGFLEESACANNTELNAVNRNKVMMLFLTGNSFLVKKDRFKL